MNKKQISQELLVAYWMGLLSPEHSAEIETELAADADLRKRGEETRSLLASAERERTIFQAGELLQRQHDFNVLLDQLVVHAQGNLPPDEVPGVEAAMRKKVKEILA